MQVFICFHIARVFVKIHKSHVFCTRILQYDIQDHQVSVENELLLNFEKTSLKGDVFPGPRVFLIK